VTVLYLILILLAVRRAFYDKYGEQKLKEGFFE
jgi:hypothetical protein